MSDGGRIKTREEKVSADGLMASPEEVRLDICSLCQLQCVLCPVGYRKGEGFIGSGVLPFADFAQFTVNARCIHLRQSMSSNHQASRIHIGYFLGVLIGRL